MPKTCLVLFFWVAPFILFAQQAVKLSCNHETNPICVDALHPRLSWQMISPRRGAAQLAYRIIVSASQRGISRNAGDIWDSKKVYTDQSLYIPYAGKALLSGKIYYWKVKVWDNTGKASPWSEVAYWRMGLLHTSDWKAKWITASKWFIPAAFRPKGFQLSAKGGWADVDLGKPMPIRLIKLFPLDSASFPRRFRVLGSDEFNFAHHAVLTDQTTRDYTIKTPGAQVFAIKPSRYRFIRLEILANNENRSTCVRQMEFFSGGKNVALMKFTREYGTDWDHGHAPFLVDGMPSQNEGDTCPADACPSTSAPMFRKTFSVVKKIKRATLYFAALGMADVTINGRKVFLRHSCIFY